MPTAQWTEPLGLELTYGLDRTAHPAWLVVAHEPQGGKQMRLRFGAGKSVRVVDERICRVEASGPEPGDPDARYFWFEGRSPGHTRVEVRSTPRGVPETALSVSVLARRRISLLFHFVTDRSGNRTVRQPAILGDLVKVLDNIYEPQAAVNFDTAEPGNEVRAPFDIVDAVYEQRDPMDRRRGSNWGALVGRHNWEKLFRAQNDNASLNIYLTPTDTSAGQNENAVPYVDEMNSTCVIEDGREPLETMLPHAIGRLLGCPLNTSDRSQLMFWDATSRRSGNFMPRACSTIVYGRAR